MKKIILSFAIFSFLTGLSIIDVVTNTVYLSFALANWLLFNIFEFGKKTFATSEERENVDTYSSLFGRTGAVALVASQSVLASYLALNLSGANQEIIFGGMGLLLAITLILSLRYVFTNKKESAKHYRNFSSVYIVIFYLILIIAHLIKN